MNTLIEKQLTRAILMSILLIPARHAFPFELVITTADRPVDGFYWNQGWWSDTKPNTATSNVSTFLGQLSGDHRNFFSFWIPPDLGTVAGATLSYTIGSGSPENEAFEEIGLYDVGVDAVMLNDNSGANAAIYADLGSGLNYGTFIVPGEGDSSSPTEFQLNSSAINAINSHIAGSPDGGYFSIGGSLLTIFGSDYFTNRGDPAALRLVFVPEPSAYSMLTLLLLMAFSFCRILPSRLAIGR